jgi:hypothetical protein
MVAGVQPAMVGMAEFCVRINSDHDALLKGFV